MEIFYIRWHNTAYMLGLTYKDNIIWYGGEPNWKIRYEINITGPASVIKEFREFIDRSLSLVDNTNDWPDVN